MPQILRTTLIADEVPASAKPFTFDLPVNPLSVILLTVKGLNKTVDLGNYASAITLANPISKVRVTYRGATIIEGSLRDLAMMMTLLTGWQPGMLIDQKANGHPRALTVPICLGRRPYDPLECFPATRRGDLVLELTIDPVDPQFDAITIQAETIELLEAVPARFTKITTTEKVHAASGEHEVELPISNDILGIGLFSPVIPITAAYLSTIGKVRVMVDNVETMYADANWETLHGELARHTGGRLNISWHGHPVKTDFAIINNETEAAIDDAPVSVNYAYMDFDPLRDGQFALRTAGAARVNLKITDDVGSATGIRVLPVELVPLAGGVPGA